MVDAFDIVLPPPPPKESAEDLDRMMEEAMAARDGVDEKNDQVEAPPASGTMASSELAAPAAASIEAAPGE